MRESEIERKKKYLEREREREISREREREREPRWWSGKSMHLPFGRSRVRFPAEVDETPPTTLVSAGLSKYRSSVLLRTRNTAKINITTSPNKHPYTMGLNIGPFPTDGDHFPPNDQRRHLLYI